MSKRSSTEAKPLIYENQKGEGSQAYIGIDCLESSFSKFFMKYLQKTKVSKICQNLWETILGNRCDRAQNALFKKLKMIIIEVQSKRLIGPSFLHNIFSTSSSFTIYFFHVSQFFVNLQATILYSEQKFWFFWPAWCKFFNCVCLDLL